MYLHITQGFAQAELPSAYGRPCLQDDVFGRIESALLSDSVIKNLDDFYFRSAVPRSWHRAWIKRQFVPAIVASFRTTKPIKTIVLVGDTDEIGTPVANYKYGKARAEAVKKEIVKQLELASRGLSDKVTIETFSRGECWPAVRGGKREARNRRVELFGVREQEAAPPASTPQPTPTQKLPNIRDIPEKTKKEIGARQSSWPVERQT